jgi:hypothetical protein
LIAAFASHSDLKVFEQDLKQSALRGG